MRRTWWAILTGTLALLSVWLALPTRADVRPATAQLGMRVASPSSDATCDASDTFALIENAAASGTITITLAPNPVKGAICWIASVNAHAVRVNPDDAHRLHYEVGGDMDIGEWLEIPSKGRAQVVFDGGTRWIVTTSTGTLVEETP